MVGGQGFRRPPISRPVGQWCLKVHQVPTSPSVRHLYGGELLYGLEVFSNLDLKRQAPAFGVLAGVAQLLLDPLRHGAFLDDRHGPFAKDESNAETPLQGCQVQNRPLLMFDPQGPRLKRFASDPEFHTNNEPTRKWLRKKR